MADMVKSKATGSVGFDNVTVHVAIAPTVSVAVLHVNADNMGKDHRMSVVL